jgi:hypothetical protein
MSIPFSEKEFEVKGMFLNTTRSFGVPREIWNFPITVAENLKAAISGKDYMYMPTVGDIVNIESRVNLDHIARAEVMDLGPEQTLEEKGGPDLFGVKWVFVPQVGGSMEDPDIPHLLNDANEWYDKVKFPDIDALDWDSVGELNAPFRKETRIVGCCFQNGLFERLISFMGFEGAALAMIDEDQQDALKELYDKLADMYINMIQHYIDQLGVQEVLFHDDWGSQRSPFFSLDTCREMLVPALRKIADWCHSKGLIFQQHSCGKNELLVPAMIDAHVDLWCGQPMNDKYMLVQKYGDKIMLGVETPTLAPDASESEIDEAAHAFVEKYNGKRIMASNRMASDAFNKAMYKYSRIALGG